MPPRGQGAGVGRIKKRAKNLFGNAPSSTHFQYLSSLPTILSLSSTLCCPCCVCSSNSILSPSLKSTNSWLWGPRCSSSSFSFLTSNMGLLKIVRAYLYQQSTLYLSLIHSFHPPWSSPQTAQNRLFEGYSWKSWSAQFLSNVKHWGGICHFPDGALVQRHSAMGTSTINTTQSFYNSC